MDLHFTSDEGTDAERAAVDAVLEGARSGPEHVPPRRRSRNLLLPALHAVQTRIGWISAGALNYVSYRLSIPPAEAYGVATFYALFSTKRQPPTVLHVCDDIACQTRGAELLCASLDSRIGTAGTPMTDFAATWKRSPCLGLCDRAAAALVQTAGVVMIFDDTIDLGEILLRIAAFFRDESCGQCVPCRVGTIHQEEALRRLLSSNSNENALLTELDQVMRDASIRGLGQTAASAIMSALRKLSVC